MGGAGHRSQLPAAPHHKHGLAGFAAIEVATFVRCTDLVIFGCAVVAMLVVGRWRGAR